ncbi:hypothetical protein Z043_102685, partial [Scleropages formosus]
KVQTPYSEEEEEDGDGTPPGLFVLLQFVPHHAQPGPAAGAMTASQRPLAGLWPWLFMAALQMVLGQTGLELAAAAVESERSAPKALIKVTPLRQEPTGKPITLEGVFAGVRGQAEGRLMQDEEALYHLKLARVPNGCGVGPGERKTDSLYFLTAELVWAT